MPEISVYHPSVGIQFQTVDKTDRTLVRLNECPRQRHGEAPVLLIDGEWYSPSEIPVTKVILHKSHCYRWATVMPRVQPQV